MYVIDRWTDRYHKNEAFSLVKCIGRLYVQWAGDRLGLFA